MAGSVVPPQSNISDLWPIDWWLIESAIWLSASSQKRKWFRRIAAGYDKSDASLLAFLYLAYIVILLI